MMNKTQPKALRGDGISIHPGDGIVPILKEIAGKKLIVVGTGFYITRYGLFLTACHVLDDMHNEKGELISRGFVVHLGANNKVHFRQILCFHRYKNSDLAIGQAENYARKLPNKPLMNLRGTLTGVLPQIGSKLVTYAYPENRTLDFSDKANLNEIKGNYFTGKLLRYVPVPEDPMMPCGYLETTIEIRSGASGGPVFTEDGKIIGVNCVGWDFGDMAEGEESLSNVIPVVEGLPIRVSNLELPEKSWELKQIPEHWIGKELDLSLLVEFGHVDFNPPLPFDKLDQ